MPIQLSAMKVKHPASVEPGSLVLYVREQTWMLCTGSTVMKRDIYASPIHKKVYLVLSESKAGTSVVLQESQLVLEVATRDQWRIETVSSTLDHLPTEPTTDGHKKFELALTIDGPLFVCGDGSTDCEKLIKKVGDSDQRNWLPSGTPVSLSDWSEQRQSSLFFKEWRLVPATSSPATDLYCKVVANSEIIKDK